VPTVEFQERRRIASAIRSVRTVVAEDVTDQFLARHPDWEQRYGDRARQFGVEDAGYHLDFLAAAIESGSAQAFADYGGWAARMLMARHIEPRFLAENLEQIGDALRRRFEASDADTVDLFIRDGVEGTLKSVSEAAPSGQLEELARMYTDAAIAGSRQAALSLVMEAWKQGHPVVDLYTEVLQRSMYRIGRLWEDNQISVAKEHMATAITQFVISHLYPLISLPQKSRGRIVITGVQGELHQVGANMVSDVLEASGWDVRFLGANMPSRGVLSAVEEHDAAILGISATMLYNVPNVMQLADLVRQKAGDGIRIIVGGSAFRSAPLLYQEIGAHGCAFDLRSAVELANGLIPAGN
jgi:MerR family transcriptional regulator, light-induced transcriptional regulator